VACGLWVHRCPCDCPPPASAPPPAPAPAPTAGPPQMVAFGFDTIGPGEMRIAVPRVSDAGVPTVFSSASRTTYAPPPAAVVTPATGAGGAAGGTTPTRYGPEGSPLADAANAHAKDSIVWLCNNKPS
jgi:hypothetical protein